MPQQRYAVVFNEKIPFGWTPHILRRFRSPVTAERWAQRIGDRHPDLRCTKSTYHERRSSLEVVDRKTEKTVWEHDPVVVPSVGELGYW